MFFVGAIADAFCVGFVVSAGCRENSCQDWIDVVFDFFLTILVLFLCSLLLKCTPNVNIHMLTFFLLMLQGCFNGLMILASIHFDDMATGNWSFS